MRLEHTINITMLTMITITRSDMTDLSSSSSLVLSTEGVERPACWRVIDTVLYGVGVRVDCRYIIHVHDCIIPVVGAPGTDYSRGLL